MLGFQQKQQDVVRQATIEDAGEGEWTSLYVELVTLGDVTSVEFLRKRPGGEDRVTDTTVHRPYRILRKAMTDEHGAWLSSSVTIERDGRYSFSFNCDEEPKWADGLPVEREGFLADLQRNPRPWAEVPDWHPAKQDYTEESWAAETQVF